MLIITGGRSEEHEISIISARSVLEVVEKTFNVTVVVITRNGHWLPFETSRRILNGDGIFQNEECILHSTRLSGQFDVVFPLLHGTTGEDGALQGMLELANIPYIGSGILASALCMDKAMAKLVLKSDNIPQVRYCLITAYNYVRDFKQFADLRAPWFVKPVNLGSSIGISKASNQVELFAAIDLAFKYDRRVIIEEAVPNVRELEVAIIGNDVAEVSVVGEVTYNADFYDYTTKYTEGLSHMHIPANVPLTITRQVQDLSIKIFRLLDCSDFARMDFFYQESSGDIFFNEVNTIPGFTLLSMFPKLWNISGINYISLIRKLVDFAIERHKKQQLHSIKQILHHTK